MSSFLSRRGRYTYGEDVKPIKKILAERTASNGSFQVAVRCGKHSHVDGNWLAASADSNRLRCCASESYASVRRKASSARLRSSISVVKLYQRTMRPSSSRCRRDRRWNQRYTPSARRLRLSSSNGCPVLSARLQASIM